MTQASGSFSQNGQNISLSVHHNQVGDKKFRSIELRTEIKSFGSSDIFALEGGGITSLGLAGNAFTRTLCCFMTIGSVLDSMSDQEVIDATIDQAKAQPGNRIVEYRSLNPERLITKAERHAIKAGLTTQEAIEAKYLVVDPNSGQPHLWKDSQGAEHQHYRRVLWAQCPQDWREEEASSL